jgi:hypothetical protein
MHAGKNQNPVKISVVRFSNETEIKIKEKFSKDSDFFTACTKFYNLLHNSKAFSLCKFHSLFKSYG